jgi:outer membrane protein assembly factor BamB
MMGKGQRHVIVLAAVLSMAGCAGHTSSLPPAGAGDLAPIRSVQADLVLDPSAQTHAAVAYQQNASHNGRALSGFNGPLSIKWKRTFLASCASGCPTTYPLIVAGKVYVGVRNTLYALDALTGKTLWAQSTPPLEFANWVGPAYDNGVIFVTLSNVQHINDPAMYAFDASTGALRWQVPLPLQLFFNAPVTAFKGVVSTIGTSSGADAYGVRELDGQLLWMRTVDVDGYAAPAVRDDGVYVEGSSDRTGCPNAYKFQPTTGALIWSSQGPSCSSFHPTATSVVANGSLYDPGDVTPIFSASTGAIQGSSAAGYAPAFEGPEGYAIKPAGTTPTTLFAFGAKSQAQIWSVTLPNGDRFATPPIVAKGIVYIEDTNGNLLSYSGSNGKLLQSVSLGTFDTDLYTESQGLAIAQGILVAPVAGSVVALTGR